jgi:heptosyltransferase-2
MNIPAKPWTKDHPPRRILAIRLQAMGDVVATLPYLQGLRDTLPADTELDFLTREETEGIPRNIRLFNRVWSVGGGRSRKKILLHILWQLPRLLTRRYDVLIDLQNNNFSKIVLKALRPKAWVMFDRFSPIAGGERYRLTIEAAGLGHNQPNHRLLLEDPGQGLPLLEANGWNGQDDLVILNPAGAFITRNWPIPNYAGFARLWLEKYPRTRFLMLGTGFISTKAAELKQLLGPHLIDLTGKTSTEEAFSIIQRVKLMLSEDSGLMHMAWISGVATMVLFGSTRSDWSRPLGPHTLFLDSSDLPCGNCMLADCRFGDVHCLTRYTPEQVFRQACSLIEKMEKKS